MHARRLNRTSSAAFSAYRSLRPPTRRYIIWGTLVWVCLKKAADYRHSDRKVPRRGYDDPCHGSPCACADSGFCRGIGAGYVPRRRQQSVANQGNKRVAARAALAVPTKEDANIFTDPCAHFQGRGGTRSLEAGHYRPFPDPQDLSDLSVVGRSWAEVL